LTLLWLPRAIADRDAQLDFIAKDNPQAALEHGDRIAQYTRWLIEHPGIGRSGRKSGTRELVVNRTPFIIVYRIKGDNIELIRLLHGAQQWPDLE